MSRFYVMGEFAAVRREEDQQRAIEERCLMDIDNLNRLRTPDGLHDDAVLEATQINLLTAVKEAAMPFAVSTTHQEYRDGTFWWLDQTPVQVAESGYKFHKHPEAIKRVDVEVEEALDTEASLKPGFIKVFISPKMSESDASYEAAKQEHLGDDDMIRIHMLDIDESQTIKGKFMQSILVRDIPLEAWVAMLKDPQNIFGKSIHIENELSALSVMKVHKELELPESALPEGTISLVEAVLPYLEQENRYKVEEQLLLFRDDQEGLHKKAEHIADRWLSFEVNLADSLEQQRATPEIEKFVFQLQHEWGDDMLRLLDMHKLEDGGIFMTRELAAKIEKAKQNTLWVSAGVITGNKDVLEQLDSNAAKKIYENEMMIQGMMENGYDYARIARLEVINNQAVAQNNVKVGGGCAGDNEADFARNATSEATTSESNESRTSDDAALSMSSKQTESGKDSWKWKSGKCRIVKCPTRPGATSVGPCEVCKSCQRIFDAGGDPSVKYASRKEETSPTTEPAKQVDKAFEAQEVEVFEKEEEKYAVRAGGLALSAA